MHETVAGAKTTGPGTLSKDEGKGARFHITNAKTVTFGALLEDEVEKGARDGHACQVIHFNFFMSIPSCQFILILWTNSFISKHSFQFDHFSSFMSIHSFIQSSIHSLTHSLYAFSHSVIHSFTHTVSQSFSHSDIIFLMHLCFHAFMRSCIHVFIHSCFHSFTRSFVRSFMRAFFIHSAIPFRLTKNSYKQTGSLAVSYFRNFRPAACRALPGICIFFGGDERP